MYFETLKDKCEYFRGLSDYRLVPNSYVIIMLDGRSFSKLIKNNYKKPFDSKFIEMMNETAKYLLQNIQGAKFAYVQSDEISILVTDLDTPATDALFGYRLCKIQSICAAMAASKFNQLALRNLFKEYNLAHGTLSIESDEFPYDDFYDMVDNQKLVEFDCKAWAVPDYNTAFCHFLWRQNDCTRNSKQQTAQTYLSHKELMGLDADKQVALLNEKNNIDWNTEYNDGEKYGRLIYKEKRVFKNLVVDTETRGLDGAEATFMKEQEYIRNVWEAHFATPFSEDGNVIKTLIPKRNEQ
jgi:tRNA(His) 5'-end guanylyltransferase